jgi:hypothetical protein
MGLRKRRIRPRRADPDVTYNPAWGKAPLPASVGPEKPFSLTIDGFASTASAG